MDRIHKWPNLWPPTQETVKQFENAKRISRDIIGDQLEKRTNDTTAKGSGNQNKRS